MDKQDRLLKVLYDELVKLEEKGEASSYMEFIREFLRLYEDRLTWKQIKDHLTKGCNCEEVKGKRAKNILEHLQEGG
ncbi:hypothetical protein ES703_24981 [subsurface metagenome]